VLGESLTTAAVAGLVLIGLGAWLTTGGRATGGKPQRPAAQAFRQDRRPAAAQVPARRQIGRRTPG
jgi:archaellin